MRILLGAVVLAACNSAPPVAPIANVTPVPPRPSHAPFAIFGALVAEDGHVVRTFSDLRDEIATPIGPDRYRIGGQILDAATGSLTAEHVPAAIRTVDSNKDEYAIDRFEPDGAVRWTQPVHGARSVRPPDLAVGGGRVVVTLDRDVRAFDDRTGALAWQAGDDGGARLQIRGEVAYHVKCNEPTHDHWLIGTRTRGRRASGSRGAARAVRPVDGARRSAHHHRGRRAHADDDRLRSRRSRALSPAGGRVAGSSESPSGAAHAIGSDLLIVTDKHIARIGDDGHVPAGASGRRRTRSSPSMTSSISTTATS